MVHRIANAISVDFSVGATFRVADRLTRVLFGLERQWRSSLQSNDNQPATGGSAASMASARAKMSA